MTLTNQKLTKNWMLKPTHYSCNTKLQNRNQTLLTLKPFLIHCKVYTRAEVFDSWFDQNGWSISHFCCKLRRSNKGYSRTRSNRGSKRVESWVKKGGWVEQGLNMGPTGPNLESIKVESWLVEGRIKSRTGSNHKSNRLKWWAEICKIEFL